MSETESLGADILWRVSFFFPMTTPLHRTTDIYLASFLISQGVPLVGFQRLRPKKTEFRFVATPALHEFLRLYWSEEPVLVIPRQLLASFFRLRCKVIARH